MVESPEKCTRQPVRIVAKNVKSHSSQILADQFTVENAGPRDEIAHQEEDIRKHLFR
jgi:hypothetical protein